MKLSDSVYDVLKWVGLIVLPSASVLVKAIFQVWNLPYGDAIATTLTALGAFIGAIIGVSSVSNSKSSEAVTSIVTNAEERDGETEYTDEAEVEVTEAQG